MKKIICILMVAFVCLGVCACGTPDVTPDEIPTPEATPTLTPGSRDLDSVNGAYIKGEWNVEGTPKDIEPNKIVINADGSCTVTIDLDVMEYSGWIDAENNNADMINIIVSDGYTVEYEFGFIGTLDDVGAVGDNVFVVKYFGVADQKVWARYEKVQ